MDFTIFEPFSNTVTAINGVANLGTSLEITGINTTNGSFKNIHIFAPSTAGLRNYNIIWPSNVPDVGNVLIVDSESYTSNGDLETLSLAWGISGGIDVFSQVNQNIYTTSLGAPLGNNNFVAGVSAANNMYGNKCVIAGTSAGSQFMSDDNICVGYRTFSSISLYISNANIENIAVGSDALRFANGVTTGQNVRNICIGTNSGLTLTIGYENICLGCNSDVSISSAINQIVIGQNAVGKGNNTVVLGNNNTTDVYVTSDSAGAPSNLVFIGDNAENTDFLYKIRAPSNAFFSSQREWILPSNTPIEGNVLQIFSVAAGPPNISTLTWGTPLSSALTSFTPTIYGGTIVGVGTYSKQQGYYITNGNMVFITVNIAWSSHTGSGNLLMDNLPFICKNVVNYDPEGIANPINIPLPGGSTSARCTISSGTSIISFFVLRSNNTNSPVQIQGTGGNACDDKLLYELKQAFQHEN